MNKGGIYPAPTGIPFCETLKPMTHEEWRAQQVGSGGSASLAAMGVLGLMLGF
jgi:hypothetical protein